LQDAGCDRVVQETASGAKTDRPMLAKLVASLKPGDIVVVTRLDRLARSTIDLLMILKAVADHEALFVSLAERWADTTTAAGRLMLTILGGLVVLVFFALAILVRFGLECPLSYPAEQRFDQHAHVIVVAIDDGGRQGHDRTVRKIGSLHDRVLLTGMATINEPRFRTKVTA
jgi:hypothetical protein